ncbi:MAG: methyltransferase domain-containing protein, partial [Candidatus Aenigmarchaeota archaeon]|nr:methyltransferase domain-containing protein [Candidatus Aenigmarchaeota archaeon]
MSEKQKIMETSEGYDGIAERYFAKWHKYSPPEVEHFGKFTQMVGKGAVYLDVGCGTGKDVFYLTQNHGLNGYGIDLSDGMLAQALKVNREDGLD